MHEIQKMEMSWLDEYSVLCTLEIHIDISYDNDTEPSVYFNAPISTD